MLECIKFGDCKVKTLEIGNEWFVVVCYIGIALGVCSDTLKCIVHNHLPQQYQFSRKGIGTDSSYNGFKLLTTIPGACRVILDSGDLDRYGVFDFLVERQNHLQDQTCNHGENMKIYKIKFRIYVNWCTTVKVQHLFFSNFVLLLTKVLFQEEDEAIIPLNFDIFPKFSNLLNS